MLLPAGQTPDNSTTPRSAAYWAAQGPDDLYSAFAAGLTIGTPCAGGANSPTPTPAGTGAPPLVIGPALASIAALSPAGSVVPMVIPASDPALSYAFNGPAPASPLAAHVASTLSSSSQGLTSAAAAPGITLAADLAGQQQLDGGPDDYSDAAEVVPIGATENMVLERQQQRTGMRQRRPGNSRRSYDLPPKTTALGTRWGGAASNQTCPPSGGKLSLGQILFLLAGGLVIAVAVSDGR